MDKQKLLIGLAIIIGIIVAFNVIGHKEMRINDYKGQVVSVEGGNTLVMKSGLKVRVLGLKSNCTSSELYLKNNVLNKKVELFADPKGKQTYRKNNETVYAYVKIPISGKKDYIPVNRYALMDCGKDAYTEAKVGMDTLRVWRTDIFSDGEHVIKTDLALYMKQRCFLIANSDGSIGTGFFINENGLALTNAHVLSEGSEHSSVAYLYKESTDDSNIYSDRKRHIKDIHWCSPLETGGMDITIFSVDLENGEKVSYFDLAKRRVQVGAECSTFGNPLGFTASYSKGHVSAYRDRDELNNRDVPLVQYDMTSNGGNSGGAVCDVYGEVFAVHELGVKEWDGKPVQGMNFGIDILAVRRVLDAKSFKYGGR